MCRRDPRGGLGGRTNTSGSTSRHAAADLHAIDAALARWRTPGGVLTKLVVKQTLEAHARSRRWFGAPAGADSAKDQSAKSRCSVRSGPATANSDLSTS